MMTKQERDKLRSDMAAHQDRYGCRPFGELDVTGLLLAADLLDELVEALPECEVSVRDASLRANQQCRNKATLGIVSHEPRWCDQHREASGYPRALRECDWAPILRRLAGREGE